MSMKKIEDVVEGLKTTITSEMSKALTDHKKEITDEKIEKKETSEEDSKEKIDKKETSEEDSSVKKELSELSSAVNSIVKRLDKQDKDNAAIEKEKEDKAKHEEIVKNLTKVVVDKVTEELGLNKTSKGKIDEDECTDDSISKLLSKSIADDDDSEDLSEFTHDNHGNKLDEKTAKARKRLADHFGKAITQASRKKGFDADADEE